MENFFEINDATEDITDEDIWDMFDKITEDPATSDKDKEGNLCIACGQDSLINDVHRGCLVCQNPECGVVNSNYLSERSDLNSYNDKGDNTSQYGCPTNFFLPKSSLGTSIGGNSYSRIKILHKWGQMPYKERSLFMVLKDIEAKCRKYDITKSIIDNAKILYKNISDCKYTSGANKGKSIIIRGMNREGLIAACVFFGCKLQGNPRSPKEIADIFGIKITKVTKGCRTFLDIMNDKILMYNIPSSQSTDFIKRAGRKLKIKKSYIDIACRITNNVNRLDIASDHQPPSVAAGSILLMSDIYDLNIDKKSISDTFKITEVTIIKTYRKIEPYKQILISDKKTERVLEMLQDKHEKNIKNEIKYDKSIFNDDNLEEEDEEEYEYEYEYEYTSDDEVS